MPARDAKPGPDRTPESEAPRQGRAERLSAALRENLKRRKAQARGRAEPEPDPPTGKSA